MENHPRHLDDAIALLVGSRKTPGDTRALLTTVDVATTSSQAQALLDALDAMPEDVREEFSTKGRELIVTGAIAAQHVLGPQ
ncbi:hypothetical protein ACSVHC_16005 [Arthrobacter sp. KNU-44]|uniref:hypothetical protein n=1 Tax=unclassified Arthrobacter TaxID=235627 RepID=UPI003F42F275